MRLSPCRARRNFRQRLVVLMPEVSHGLEATGGVNIRLVGWNGGRRLPDKTSDWLPFPQCEPTSQPSDAWRHGKLSLRE